MDHAGRPWRPEQTRRAVASCRPAQHASAGRALERGAGRAGRAVGV